MPVLDDSAILRTREEFIRPSDLVNFKTVNLLTVGSGDEESYQEFTVEPVYASYAKIRFSHGAILNLGFDSVMVGTIKTGYSGCKPIDTADLVSDITKNFKYRSHITSDFYTYGDKEYLINLEEFTDRKSGTYNIATPEFYKFLGWCARTGRLVRDGYSIGLTVAHSDKYDGLIESLPLEVIETTDNPERIRIKFKINWFIDVIRGLCGYSGNYFLADDITLHCTHKLAKAFREGFIACNVLRPYFKDADAIRYDCRFDDDNVGDLLFVLRRAGFDLVLTNDTVGYRIAEQTLTISEYVQSVTHIEVPKLMYDVKPVKSSTINPLWVSGVLFKAK